MRYLLLLLIPSLISVVFRQQALAATSDQNQNVDGNGQTRVAAEPSPTFWPQAQRLVQEQIYLINRIEKALTGTDLNRAIALRDRLAFHQRAVEWFLKSQYPIPAFVCGQSSTNGSSVPESNLSVQQAKVYCALIASSQQLAPLGALLENRMARLADLTKRNPVTDSPREERQNLLSLRAPAPSKYLPLPNLPPAETPLIGIRAKTPIADYVPPMQPAIAIPEQAVQSIQNAKQLLAPAIAAFSPTTFTDPAADAQAMDRLSHTIYSKEPPLFAEFLALPNTGIVRVLPGEAYLADRTQIANRLQPTVRERFPFAQLLPNRGGLTPRLAIRIESGNFKIAQPELDYGFMVDLGEVPLENLKLSTKGDRGKLSLEDVSSLSPQIQEFFFNYRPPTKLTAIQEDRQRFITGKLGNFPLSEPVLTQAPAVLNHTYLARLVQYKVPQVILNRGAVSRTERSNLTEILQTPSSDLLVAFRPVTRRSDGSYTVLWRLLTRFPDPQITDLEKYIYLE